MNVPRILSYNFRFHYARWRLSDASEKPLRPREGSYRMHTQWMPIRRTVLHSYIRLTDVPRTPPCNLRSRYGSWPLSVALPASLSRRKLIDALVMNANKADRFIFLSSALQQIRELNGSAPTSRTVSADGPTRLVQLDGPAMFELSVQTV